MDNLESETEEVFFQGKSYRRLNKGFGRKQPKKGVDQRLNLAPFQELLHKKGMTLQNNTDEVEEPQKPDYDVF